MNKTKTLSTLLIFIFTTSIIFAQGELGERALTDIESSMEANLTWNLQNALLLYYNQRIRAAGQMPSVIEPAFLPEEGEP